MIKLHGKLQPRVNSRVPVTANARTRILGAVSASEFFVPPERKQINRFFGTEITEMAVLWNCLLLLASTVFRETALGT